MFTVHYYYDGRCKQLDIANILPEDQQYFEENDIKVSMEELKGEFIIYGCPYLDYSEESEVIVFANGRTCEESLSELANLCKNKFK